MPPFLFIFFLSSLYYSFCVVVGVGTAGLGVVPAVFDGNASYVDADCIVGCVVDGC